MTPKIKFVLGILAIVALFSVAQLYGSFQRTSAFKVGIQPQEALANPDEDLDHDGLTNIEESYWNTDFQNPDSDGDGFKDGEEVASGHDPAIKGPKDFLDAAANINLTEKTAGLIVAGISATDLKPESLKYNEALQHLSLATIQDFYDGQPAPPEQPRSIKTTKQSKEEYLNALAEVIRSELLNFSLSYAPAAKKQNSYFTAKSIQFKKAYASLSSRAVPEEFAHEHWKIMDILRRLEVNYYSIGRYESDPLKAAMAFNEIGTNITQDVHDVLKAINIKIINDGLRPHNEFYEMLGLIFRDDVQ